MEKLKTFLQHFSTAPEELKIFINFGLISAGESDMATDLISNLYASGSGFKPLIFDLQENQEQKVDFKKLMTACHEVWIALEMDPNLPQKLVRNADFLRHIYTILGFYCSL